MQELWEQVKSILEINHPDTHISCWLQDVHVSQEQQDHFVLYCPNQFSQKWIENNYLSLVVRQFRTVVGQEVKVSVKALTDAYEDPSTHPPSSEVPVAPHPYDDPTPAPLEDSFPRNTRPVSAEESQLDTPHTCAGLNRKYGFSNFVVGACNRFAWAAAQEVCTRPQGTYNPFYVYSSTGLGKTHLGQAIGHMLYHKHPSRNIRWCTTEHYCADMIFHMKNKSLPLFKGKYRDTCDVFCLDDIQFLRGKEWVQEELCFTFDALLNEGKQIILMGQIPPHDQEGFKPELTSRMFSGLTARMYPPEKETRIAMIRSFASRMNVSMPDSIIETIANTVRTHIRNLEGAVIRISAMSSLLNLPLDEELVGEVLRDFQEKRIDTFSLETIRDHVAKHFQLSGESLRTRSRKHAVFYCRQIAMYLSRKYTQESLHSIGALYMRDHASVHHAIQSLEQKMQRSSRVRREVAFIEENLLKERC